MASRSIFVGGTSSHTGKSWMCTAICAWLKRNGVRVAPFKAQNMSNNSFPCLNGGEIGRAQVAQAYACGLEPETDMNPILLKPTSPTGSQVVVNGKVWKTLPARAYYEHFDSLLQVVLDAYDRLSSRYDYIVIEGAGSVAELNLRQCDLANFGLAIRVGAPALLVGDIERGGVFASILGSIALLEPSERALLRAFAVNKFRGDLCLFEEGRRILETRSGLPCLGVFPWVAERLVDDEDSLCLPPCASDHFGAAHAIVRFPRISNATDFRLIPDVAWVDRPVAHQFQVIFLPGTKNTIGDLRWLKQQKLDLWLLDQAAKGAQIVGICGGYQMMGERIQDPDRVESDGQEEQGLGLFPITTTLTTEKTVRRVRGSTAECVTVEGYEIHMGQSAATAPVRPLFQLEGLGPEGSRIPGCIGTYLHGALECPDFLQTVLRIDPLRVPGKVDRHQKLAEWLDQYGPHFPQIFL